MDRTDISVRGASLVVTTTVSADGTDVTNVGCSRETVRRHRNTSRESIANRIKKNFEPKNFVTIHWDGKIMKSLDSKEKVDRLAVVATGPNNLEQLLGVPVIKSSTGESQAEAVFQLMKKWDLLNNIKFICTDTTASNTGIRNGACTLLQKKMDENLAYFACRHHMLECVVSSVYNSLFEVPKGPVIKLFDDFKKNWKHINKGEFKSASSDENIWYLIEHKMI